MKALLTFLFLTDILVSSHPDHHPSPTDKPLKVPYPYKMHSLGHDAGTGIKNTYQGESYGNIYIINHPGYGNDIVIHNYPAGANEHGNEMIGKQRTKVSSPGSYPIKRQEEHNKLSPTIEEVSKKSLEGTSTSTVLSDVKPEMKSEDVTNPHKIEEAFEESLETTLSPTTTSATSENQSETEVVTMVESVDALPNQIELGDYLYNQEDDKEDDYEGDYFYDFGNSPFAESVDELVKGF